MVLDKKSNSSSNNSNKDPQNTKQNSQGLNNDELGQNGSQKSDVSHQPESRLGYRKDSTPNDRSSCEDRHAKGTNADITENSQGQISQTIWEDRNEGNRYGEDGHNNESKDLKSDKKKKKNE